VAELPDPRARGGGTGALDKKVAEGGEDGEKVALFVVTGAAGVGRRVVQLSPPRDRKRSRNEVGFHEAEQVQPQGPAGMSQPRYFPRACTSHVQESKGPVRCVSRVNVSALKERAGWRQ